MLKNIINFYRVSQPKPCNEESLSEQKQRLKRFQWSTFLAATLGYGMYYVCRLSLNVVKKPIVDEGVFSETELGIIGAVLFFTYAVGKFMNGFLADRSNINHFMSTGLLVTALVNLCLGFVHSFISVCRSLGYQRMVSVYGCCFLCGRLVPLVHGQETWFFLRLLECESQHR